MEINMSFEQSKNRRRIVGTIQGRPVSMPIGQFQAFLDHLREHFPGTKFRIYGPCAPELKGRS